MVYYGNNDWRDYHLSHHGVLGMHWGIRRYQPYGVGYQRKGGETGKNMGEARTYASAVESYKQKELSAINKKYDRKFSKQQERFNKLNESYSKVNKNNTKKIDKIDKKMAKLSSEMYTNRAMKEVETSKVMNYTYEDVVMEQRSVMAKKAKQVVIGTIIAGPLAGATVGMLTGTGKQKTSYRTEMERDSIREKAKALENASYEGVKKLNGNSNPEAEARRIADKAGNGTNEVKFKGQNDNGTHSQIVRDRVEKAADDVRKNKYYDYNDYSDDAMAADIVRNGKNPTDENIKKLRKATRAYNSAYEKNMNYREHTRDFNPDKYNKEQARRYQEQESKTEKEVRRILDEMDDLDY